MTTAAPMPNLKRRLAKGGAWAFAGKGGTLALNFATVALVARVLPPTEAGAFFLAQSLVTAAAMVTRLGLETTVVFLVSRAIGEGDPGRARRIIGRVVTLGATSALFAGVVLALGGGAFLGRAIFHSDLVASVGTNVGLWTAALSLQVLVSEAFRGFHDIRDATLFGGLLSGALTVIGLGAFYVYPPLASLRSAALLTTLSTSASTVVSALALWYRAERFPEAQVTPAPSYAEVLREALPVLVNNVMTFVLLSVDVWVIGAHIGESRVAVYAAAAKMVTLVSLTFMIVNQVIPPVVGELKARGDQALLERVLRGTAAAVAPPALVTLGVFVFAGEWVMRTAFGDFYVTGAPILALLACAHIVGVLTGSSVTVLLMTGNQRAAMWISGAAAVAATIGAMVAVRFAGTVGVALAIGLVLASQQVATLIAARKLAGVWTHADFRLIRPAIAEVLKLRRRGRE